MGLVTLDEARTHCRADAADDAYLTEIVEAASLHAEAFLNRRVFVDSAALQAAVGAVPAELEAAAVAYEAAVVAAEAMESESRDAHLAYAESALLEARERARATYAGVVVNQAIRAAVLLIVGHLYRNREDVVTGSGAAAAKLPMGAEALLWPWRVGLGI